MEISKIVEALLREDSPSSLTAKEMETNYIFSADAIALKAGNAIDESAERYSEQHGQAVSKIIPIMVNEVIATLKRRYKIS